MLTIWGRTNSINVMKVLWACDEAGVPYERINAGMQFGVVDTPEYGRMNPNRRVPTINDDGFTLWESNTIVRYLAARQAREDLLPGAPQARADVERWMDWTTASLTVGMTPLFWQLIRTPEANRNPAVLAQATQDAARGMHILNDHLGSRTFMSADRFTVADIAVAAFVHRWLALPCEHPNLPALQAYYERMLLREPYRTHVAVPLT